MERYVMAELTAYEAGWRKVCNGLDNHPGIEISYGLEGQVDTSFADAVASWEALVGSREIEAPAGLEQCYLRFQELGRQWGAAEANVDGEFYLTHIARAVSPADLTWISSVEGDERFPSSELRIIDEHPITGTGHYAALRALPGRGEPEIWWVATPRYGAWKMGVGYREYLEMLQLTKGAFGWQFLFTWAPLGNEEFKRVCGRIEGMLDALPLLFPEHDYEPLRERFSARLRDGCS
ncbi:hypothetical protein [Nonomuraea helvata]|uniref:Uncharacterized protein n=1 Tax=Nonomuraea helvata TaxID=37484 RepID=A0ABV5SDT6_9ACTN